MPLRLVVADDNADFLRELVSTLSVEFEVVATAQDGCCAVTRVLSCRPDVVVLDLQMPTLNGIEVIKRLRDASVKVGVVICSVENDPEIIEAALQAGALGYVFKERVESDLLPAVRSAASGYKFVSPA